MKYMFEKMKKNYIGTILGAVAGFVIAVLYYVVGMFNIPVEPVNNLLAGKFVIVMIVLGVVGMLLGSFLEVGR